MGFDAFKTPWKQTQTKACIVPERNPSFCYCYLNVELQEPFFSSPNRKFSDQTKR